MKKHQKANLEARRGMFFQTGLILALATTLVAFEWTSYDRTADYVPDEIYDGDLIVEIIKPHKVPRPPAPIFKQKTFSALITPIITIDPSPGEPIVEPFTFTLEPGDIEGECEDCPPEVPIDVTVDANTLQKKPYYQACASTDWEEQSNCSFIQIKNFVMEDCDYPRICKEAGIQGRVWVSFVVDKKGNIGEVESIRGPHELLEKAAVMAVQRIPQMMPGERIGKPVKVRFNIPVDFILN
ncbi:MAG: protein TonB [Flavobacteriales bacterium]|jgi:protein TonB